VAFFLRNDGKSFAAISIRRRKKEKASVRLVLLFSAKGSFAPALMELTIGKNIYDTQSISLSARNGF
jgi:hypothetical protein